MKAYKSQDREYRLNQLYFYLTEGCNLCCRHCWISPKYQSPHTVYPSLDPDLFYSIIQQAKNLGLTGVKLTGGEPLLHPHIIDMVKVIRSEDLGLTIETNGILCTRNIAKEIAKGKNPFVAVSLDGTDAKTHEWVRRVEGSFEAALKGIKNLVKAGVNTQIIMSIMKRNKDQIEPMVLLAESLGVNSIKFNPVQPTARGEKMHEAMEVLSIEELEELGRWMETSLCVSTNLRLCYDHPPAFRPLGKLFGKNAGGGGVCGILSILGVLPDGSYALCGIGTTVPELVFGHAAKHSLAVIWRENSVLNELRDGLPSKLEGICNDCVMKFMCKASCIAQNYVKGKSLWSPFWYCHEAWENGLFPKTRIYPK